MNIPFTTTAAVIAGYLGFSISTDVATVMEPRSLTLETLHYNDDQTVTQRLSGNISAMWSVRVHRTVAGVTSLLCEGAGDTPGIYTGNTSTWSVSDWVGDDCPPLLPGDNARAAWEYVNDTGTPVTVIGTFIVGETTTP